jgi:hypothetical protein
VFTPSIVPSADDTVYIVEDDFGRETDRGGDVLKSKRRPTLGGRELSDAELAEIRAALACFDAIGNVSDEMRALIADQWPDQLAKLAPKQQH